MDKLYEKGLSSLFLIIALAVVKKYNINIDFSHLDSSSFAVEGKYNQEKITDNFLKKNLTLERINQIPIRIIKGYSRDHRPDLKQFILDLIVSSDGDIPLFLRVASGNENDKAVFGKIASEYKSMIDFETMIVGDSALYTENNLKLMNEIEWLSRVPLSIKDAKNLVSELPSSDFIPSSLEGYSWYEVSNNYAEIEQRWLIVESEKRKIADLEKLRQKIEKEKEKTEETLKKLRKEEFRSSEGAKDTILRLNKTLKYHQITALKIKESELNNHRKKSPKKGKKLEKTYQITAVLKSDLTKIKELEKRAGRFVLATNRLDKNKFSADEMLIKYKEQQSAERGFGFLKDPLFFADSVFLKSPKRIETMAMLMGLCLLVYSLGQREVRRLLKEKKTGIKNQLGKLTERPTLRWIFQCFQGIHLVINKGIKQIVNLTNERKLILSFFPISCQNYYILSG
jgi:transposase